MGNICKCVITRPANYFVLIFYVVGSVITRQFDFKYPLSIVVAVTALTFVRMLFFLFFFSIEIYVHAIYTSPFSLLPQRFFVM